MTKQEKIVLKEDYEKFIALPDIQEQIKRSRDDIANGRVYSSDEVLDTIKMKLGMSSRGE